MNMPFRSETMVGPRIIRQVGMSDAATIDKIDDFVATHKDATPFHRSAWMKAIENACGHHASYLLAEGADGAIEGLLPLHIIHSPLFGRALVSSGFAVGGGILADKKTVVNRLSEAAWNLAERYSCPTIELRGGQLPSKGWIEKQDAYAGFSTPLAEDDESQLLAIPRKQRAEVRKGLKNEMAIRIGTSDKDRTDHYSVYSESVRNLGTPVFPKALFDAVIDEFGSDVDILTVLNEGRPVASVLSLYHDGNVMPYWGGGTREARGLRANDVMYYALMNHAREKGCSEFDFGRSKVGTGAFHFKKNWGFEPRPLSYAIRTADGQEPRDVNPLSPKYRLKIAMWQRLPLSVANMLGPHIAKGLG